MKRLILAAAVVAAAMSAPVFAADVGVSVSIGQPGFYGRLDIGGYPPPQVIYSQPRVVERVYVEREPVYMRVPPAMQKTGVNTAIDITPVASVSTLCKIIGTAMTMHHATKSNIAATKMTVVTNTTKSVMMSAVMITVMVQEIAMAIMAKGTINISYL